MNRLSRRENEIVELIADKCLGTLQIANTLNLAEATVVTHRANIFKKLDCHSVAEVCRLYWNEKLSEPALAIA